MAELADAPDLGSGVNDVGVQVPPAAPISKNPNLVPIGTGFGFFSLFRSFDFGRADFGSIIKNITVPYVFPFVSAALGQTGAAYPLRSVAC